MYVNLFTGNAILLVALALAFGLLKFFQIAAGTFLDWLLGLAILEWLLVIVTVPWNIYFAARQTTATAMDSQQKGIAVEQRQINYAQNISTRSLILAIVLHLLSAAGLYWVAQTGFTPLGYWGAAAALLLTALRPAISTYEYLAQRLRDIQQEFTYPREDIYELRNRLSFLENETKLLQAKLDETSEDSWLSDQNQRWQRHQIEIANANAQFQELQATNKIEHDRLSRESQQAISQLTVDGQFLDHVREIIRFFKTA
jgi:uncharacterized membrane protein YfbV (UPF0208 family)